MLVATVTRKHIQARLRYMIKCHEKEVREKKSTVHDNGNEQLNKRIEKRIKRRSIQEQVESELFSQSINYFELDS